MKSQRLTTRRQPARKGIMKHLHAVTGPKRRPKRQNGMTTTAPSPAEHYEDGGSKVSRALTIIFIIHILALGMIFFHQRFLEDRSDEPVDRKQAMVAASREKAMDPVEELPIISNGQRIYAVEFGDNYSRIAERFGVDETELREINGNVVVQPKLILKIPSRRIQAQDSPEVAEIAMRDERRREELANANERATPPAPTRDPAPAPTRSRDEGLVDVTPPGRVADSAPDKPLRAVPVAESTGVRTHTVKSGESVWGISNKYKVSEKELMQLNGIKDPRRMRIGMELKIP